MPELTKGGQRILEIIENHEGWIDRSQLSKAMDKKQLNPHDMKLLEDLINLELIEVDTQISGITEKYVYRKK